MSESGNDSKIIFPLTQADKEEIIAKITENRALILEIFKEPISGGDLFLKLPLLFQKLQLEKVKEFLLIIYYIKKELNQKFSEPFTGNNLFELLIKFFRMNETEIFQPDNGFKKLWEIFPQFYKQLQECKNKLNIYFADKSSENFRSDLVKIIMDILNIEIKTKENIPADLSIITEIIKQYYEASIKLISPKASGISAEVILGLFENLFLFSDYQFIMNIEKEAEKQKTDANKEIIKSSVQKEQKEHKEQKEIKDLKDLKDLKEEKKKIVIQKEGKGDISETRPRIDEDSKEGDKDINKFEKLKENSIVKIKGDGNEGEEYIMPSNFEVEIHIGDNQIKMVNVEVERSTFKKPFLGGFIHKANGNHFHNAFAQTDQVQKDHPIKNHREAQTHIYMTKSTKMMREFSSQTAKEGIFIDETNDRKIICKPCFTSEMWLEQRIKKTLYVQCAVRGWIARRLAARLRKERDDRDLEIIKKDEEKRKKEEEDHKRDIERRMHPKNKDDFEILYNELEAWRLNEIQKIKEASELNEEEKQKALRQLLKKETKLLQTIDKLKISADSINREEKIEKLLKAMAAPKIWKRSDQRFTEVHTPFTTRAKELMDLYNGLKMPFLSIDERLDILLHAKWTVNEFDCNLTREIVDLIDREADMLNRGRPEKSLEGLRKRLCNLFLQFIETPEFNPEAKKFQKVPRELLQQTSENIFE